MKRYKGNKRIRIEQCDRKNMTEEHDGRIEKKEYVEGEEKDKRE
jgi:hypothetical protein